jgi:glycerophosphoryl diester phosphodiesterase
MRIGGWVVLVLLSACGGEPASPSASVTPQNDASTAIVDPALFDCTATVPPKRTSTVPIGCATDPSCTTRLVSGHRGVGGQLGVIAPENTVAAVRAAIAMGIDFIETDPRETKDGVLVNVHDTDIKRTMDGTGAVAELTLAELKAIPLKTEKFTGDFSCERVATIEEILTAAKGKVHVLLDANKSSRVDLLVEAVHQTGTLDWAIFDTDSVEKIDEALQLEPALLTMIRVKDEGELDSELAHFAAHPPVIVEIHDTAKPAPLIAAIHAKKARVLMDAFATDAAAGFDDDPSHYEALFAMGTDIAQTDRPDLVLRYLKR